MEDDIFQNSKNDPSKLRDAISDELDSYINSSAKGEAQAKVMPQIPKEEVPIFKPVVSQPIQNTEQRIKPVIRTYKGDIEETVQSGHISSVNIAISENKRMMRNVSFGSANSSVGAMNWGIIITIIVLLLGGVLAIFVPYYLVNKENAPVVQKKETVEAKSIIRVDTEEKVNIKDLNLSRISKTLADRVSASSINLGSIKNIYLTEGSGTSERIVTAQEFLSFLKADVPESIQRTLRPDYMFGMYNYNGNQEFLILRVGAYDLAYSGMLSWEENLWQNYKDLFNLSDSNSDTTNKLVVEIKKFQDATFFNKDARVVKDSAGKIIFLYSIVDENTIVLTTSTDTLKEILNRINDKRNITQ